MFYRYEHYMSISYIALIVNMVYNEGMDCNQLVIDYMDIWSIQ